MDFFALNQYKKQAINKCKKAREPPLAKPRVRLHFIDYISAFILVSFNSKLRKEAPKKRLKPTFRI